MPSVDRGYDMLDAITRHSEGFLEAARGNLGAAVEHCPGWEVSDLVWHLTEVQWFWATIVEERLAAPADESTRPVREADGDRLLDAFGAGAHRLVSVLGAAAPSEHVWTWAPAQQDVAFVTRHQVQEAAVHHWDARHAAGGRLTVEPHVAADAVDEFLTFSVSSDADPADPPRPALDGAVVLRCTDVAAAWTLTDGRSPGTVTTTAVATPGHPEVAASASDLLLWLYRRVVLDTGGVPADLLARFRALTYTD
jgi:uncharacterized protein (TIGR03083 family)